jgi:hypothetical protein
MRRAARVDANQTEIVQALRGVGATVAITSMVGQGYPDLTVGYHGRNYLLEIKDGSKPPSKRRLTPDEQEFHDTWRGTVFIVNSVDEALQVLGVTYYG